MQITWYFLYFPVNLFVRLLHLCTGLDKTQIMCKYIAAPLPCPTGRVDVDMKTSNANPQALHVTYSTLQLLYKERGKCRSKAESDFGKQIDALLVVIP